MHLPDPNFPPLLSARSVKRPVDPLPDAVRGVGSGEFGAGDLIWSRRTDRVELAIVLEPEVTLARSMQMMALTMVALGEGLGQLLPPQVAVEYRWPRDVLINGGLAGRIELVASSKDAADVPDWLIVSVGLQLARREDEREPGHSAHLTSLTEEGGGDITRSEILETFGAYFMTWMHGWETDGFRPLHDQWLFRAAGRTSAEIFPSPAGDVNGNVLGLDEEAGLIIKASDGKARVLPYLPFLMTASDVSRREAL